MKTKVTLSLLAFVTSGCVALAQSNETPTQQGSTDVVACLADVAKPAPAVTNCPGTEQLPKYSYHVSGAGLGGYIREATATIPATHYDRTGQIIELD